MIFSVNDRQGTPGANHVDTLTGGGMQTSRPTAERP
jgi:hypothetical protein